ncbi:hypothetical protein V3C99_001298 [Haemonchus contortus]
MTRYSDLTLYLGFTLVKTTSELSKTHSGSAKAAFKQLNRQHNPNIKWSDELEQRALEYLDPNDEDPNDKVMVIGGQKFVHEISS